MGVFRPLPLAAGMLFIAASLQATTYDLTTALDANSSNSNPFGVWSLLNGTTVMSYLTGGSCGEAGLGLNYYASTARAGSPCPASVSVATGSGPSSVFQSGDIIAYSSDAPSVGLFIDWTAPVAGTITVSGDIWYAHPSVSRSNNFTLALGGTTLATGTVAYNSGYTRSSPDTFSGGGPLAVAAGEVLSLEIIQTPPGAIDTGNFDGVDVSVTETPAAGSTPEPRTVLLLGSALGLARLSHF